MTRTPRLCWAVSGQGRAFQAVLQAVDAGLLPVEVVAVVTDRASPIEEVAAARGLPWYRVEPAGGPYDPRFLAALIRHEADWLGLTFNRLLSEEVIAHLGGRVFNLHLSLLPMFPGFGSIPRTLSAGMRLTAVTVHLIDGQADQGTILSQAAVAVTGADTRETLGRRMFDAALPLLLQIVRSIGTGELRYDDARSVDWKRSLVAPSGPAHAFPVVDDDIAAFARRFCEALDEG